MNSNTSQIRFRFAFDLALFFAVLYVPWWFTIGALLAGVFRFTGFFEAFFFALFFDILYGGTLTSLHGFRFLFSASFLFLIFIVDFLKTKIRIQ
jgi:hypothetical protein